MKFLKERIELTLLVVTLATILIGGGIAYGSLKEEVHATSERVERMEPKLGEVVERVANIEGQLTAGNARIRLPIAEPEPVPFPGVGRTTLEIRPDLRPSTDRPDSRTFDGDVTQPATLDIPWETGTWLINTGDDTLQWSPGEPIPPSLKITAAPLGTLQRCSSGPTLENCEDRLPMPLGDE